MKLYHFVKLKVFIYAVLKSGVNVVIHVFEKAKSLICIFEQKG